MLQTMLTIHGLYKVFSVDLDPSRGGEHVNANYLMNYDDGENTAAVNVIFKILCNRR